MASIADAQQNEERPQITPVNRNVPKKKVSSARAVALLQLGSDGKSTLLPIAILINGKFWDAASYKADPIPMALEGGSVYEVERTGTSLGLFTVGAALHSNAVNVLSPWIGTGKWVPAGSEDAKTAQKAEAVPVGIDTGEQAPRLTRDPAKVHTAPDSATAPSTTPASPSSKSSAPSSPGSDDDRPRIVRGTPTPAPDKTPSDQPQASSGSNPQSSGSKPSDSKPADSKPAEGKPADAKPDESATASKPEKPAQNIPASDSGASAASRPTLRRGKPVDALPDDDIPGYSKPGASSTTASTGKPVPAANAIPPQLIPAISDATGPDPHPYGFSWLKDEEGERRDQMIALATEKVRAYIDARAKARIEPKSAGAPSAKHVSAAKNSSAASSSAKRQDPILENVLMPAFDLWGGNQPVMVFSAEAHVPPAPAGSAVSAVDAQLHYWVLLIAYPDIYNNIHPIFVGVTDRYHLDLTPRLELIDALDADGDLRGELLFRETSDAGTGWIIYRASADKLWKLFDSLHPE